nr:MAG TPA: hypothetical protein [Caudoviricetes sp.]
MKRGLNLLSGGRNLKQRKDKPCLLFLRHI